MAVFGFGASYGGTEDVSRKFISLRAACVGYSPKEAPTLHTMLRYIKMGDIVYLKSHPPNIGLIVKAVGIVVGNEVKEYKKPNLGWGIKVEWIWWGKEELGKIEDKYAVRNLTLYEEHDYKIQKKVLDLLLSRLVRKGKK